MVEINILRLVNKHYLRLVKIPIIGFNDDRYRRVHVIILRFKSSFLGSSQHFEVKCKYFDVI